MTLGAHVAVGKQRKGRGPATKRKRRELERRAAEEAARRG